MPTFLSLVAPKVVMTTSGATIDNKVGIMTTRGNSVQSITQILSNFLGSNFKADKMSDLKLMLMKLYEIIHLQNKVHYIHGLVQDCGISIENAVEIPQYESIKLKHHDTLFITCIVVYHFIVITTFI